jgi:choline dehydrogenase-like flavoprotein
LLLEVTSPLPGVGAVSLPGAGPELKQALADYKHLASVGLFVSDSATGRGVGNRRLSEPLAFYSLSRKDAACLQRGIALAAEVFLEAGALTVYTGLARLPTVAGRRELERLRDMAIRSEDLTVVGFHPMGTCRMGRDAATSVVGPYGESHALRNLFLADASVLPSCAGVNPQVTIMALATRTAFHLREQGGRYFG